MFDKHFYFQVNVPKQRKTFCKGKNCKKHTLHKVTQYKKGRDSIHVQGNDCSSVLSCLPYHFIVKFITCMMKKILLFAVRCFVIYFSMLTILF